MYLKKMYVDVEGVLRLTIITKVLERTFEVPRIFTSR